MPPLQSIAKDPRQSLTHVDPDEQHLATVYRHPFGIFTLYAQVFVGLAAAAGLIWFLLPNFIDAEEESSLYGWFGLGLVVIAALMLLVMFAATIIYRQSKLIITNKSITQIVQEGLVNRKISQLSVANIEDVTADRRGLFQTALNFGVLFIETAGEAENFYFYFCPNPDHYAKLILEARQQYLMTFPEGGRRIAGGYAGAPEPVSIPPQPYGAQPYQQYPPQPQIQQQPQQPYGVEPQNENIQQQ